MIKMERARKTGAVTALVLLALIAAPAESQTPIPQGGEFQINTYTTYGQQEPVVAPGLGGEFLVVWYSFGSFGTDDWASSIQGQRYDAAGMPLGGEFQINTYYQQKSGGACGGGPGQRILHRRLGQLRIRRF